MAPKAAQQESPNTYNGLDIIERAIVLQKTGDGLSKSVGIAPRVCVTDEVVGFAGMMRHRRTAYENVYAKDEEAPRIIGVRQVDTYDALGVIIDDRDDVAEAVNDMIRRIADEEDRAKAAKAGEVRLPFKEAAEKASARKQAKASKVREIRPGVADDEGAGESSGDTQSDS
jgi:hypothetical protein